MSDSLKKTEIIHRIRRTLAVFHQAGDTVEIRVLGIPTARGKPHNAAGYFRDIDAAAAAAAEYDMQRKPAAIYFVMNQCDPALYARSPDRITDYLSDTTTDHDILRRRWLLVDVDPTRPKGIGSTEEQLAAANEMAERVREWLMDQGWPEPIVVMSGNGFHLLFPIDLPNDKPAAEMVAAILKVLDAKFSIAKGGRADPGRRGHGGLQCGENHQALRHVVRKGHSTAEQPHRRSGLIYVPDYLEVQQVAV